VSDYQSVSWSDDEDITSDKLNRMARNEDYLEGHYIDQSYSAYGITKVDGLKIAAGVVTMGPNAGIKFSKEVHFGNFFTVGCQPAVTATLATISQTRAFCTIKGIAAADLNPNHVGFVITLENAPAVALKNNFGTFQHVHWIAVGF
jgi:hypothetical protein